MSVIATLAFLVLLVVAQTAVMPFAALSAVKPVLPILGVVSWGLVRGTIDAAWWALGLGFLMDALSPSPPGSYTLPMLAVAAVVMASRGRMFPSNLVLPGILAVLATVAFSLTQKAMIAVTLRDAPGVSWTGMALVNEILPAVVLNLLWLPALYFPLRYVAERTGPPRMEWGR